MKGSRGFSSSVTRTFETLTRKFKLSILPNSSSSSFTTGDEIVCGNGVVASVRKYATGREEKEGLSKGSFAGRQKACVGLYAALSAEHEKFYFVQALRQQQCMYGGDEIYFMWKRSYKRQKALNHQSGQGGVM